MKPRTPLARTTHPQTLAAGPNTTVAARLLLLLLLLFALPVAARAHFAYTTSFGQVTISRYDGPGGAVDIPRAINGLPVTAIGNEAFSHANVTSVTIPESVNRIENLAFAHCTGLTKIMIPDSVILIGDIAFFDCTRLTNVTIGKGVTRIGDRAFEGCSSLTGVYFQGNAPRVQPSAFSGGIGKEPTPTTIYHLPGSLGWEATFAGRPTALWNPQALTSDASFGVREGRFGFTIHWASGKTVVVEACTNPGNPTWTPVGTNTLTGGSTYFSDADWAAHPARFYRLRSP
jgi:hypothetical protein